MKKLVLLLGFLSLLGGCAANPTLTELRQGVQSVVLVQNGTRPLLYSTGVIDTSSFWAAYGDGVGAQTGGLMWNGIAASQRGKQLSKAEQNALMVQTLYGEHDLAPTVYRQIMPKLAAAWSQSYSPEEVVILSDMPAVVEEGLLKNFNTNADLVLMLEVNNINLTERFSMGGAFAAGLTMGTNTKSLTTEAKVLMRAFKPSETSPGNYEMAWWRFCGSNYATMKTSYTLEELKAKPELMQQILDEARGQAVESCTEVLEQEAARA